MDVAAGPEREFNQVAARDRHVGGLEVVETVGFLEAEVDGQALKLVSLDQLLHAVASVVVFDGAVVGGLFAFEVADQRAFHHFHVRAGGGFAERVLDCGFDFHVHALDQQEGVERAVVFFHDAVDGRKAAFGQARLLVARYANVFDRAFVLQVVREFLQQVVRGIAFRQRAPVQRDVLVVQGDDRLLEGGFERHFQLERDRFLAVVDAGQQRHGQLQAEEAPAGALLDVEAQARAGNDEEQQMLFHGRVERELHAALVAADRVAEVGHQRVVDQQVVPVETALGNRGFPGLGGAAAWWERRLDVVVPVHKISNAFSQYLLLTIV